MQSGYQLTFNDVYKFHMVFKMMCLHYFIYYHDCTSHFYFKLYLVVFVVFVGGAFRRNGWGVKACILTSQKNKRLE